MIDGNLCNIRDYDADDDDLVIISSNGDVNWSDWCEGSIVGKFFDLENHSVIYIETKEDVEEFREMVLFYFTVNKGEL